jgi:hypothetical protein
VCSDWGADIEKLSIIQVKVIATNTQKAHGVCIEKTENQILC